MLLPTILIVDDVPETRAILAKIISKKQILALEASTGNEALVKIEKHPTIELVLLDIGLPDMDGYKVMEEINKLRENRNIKVLFVSGKKDKEDVVKAIQKGGDDYLVKPVYPDTLLSKISLLLNRKLRDSFSSVKCGFSARMVDSDILPDLHVVELSEMTLVLRSTAAIREEVQIEIDSKKLNYYLKHDSTMTLKVSKCKKDAVGKYFLRCRFIGVSENVLKEIRALTIQGKFLS